MQPKHNHFPNNPTTETACPPPPSRQDFVPRLIERAETRKKELLKRRGGSSVPDKNTSLSQQPVSLFFNLMANVTGDQRTEP